MMNFNWAQTFGQQTPLDLRTGSLLSFQRIFTRSISISMKATKTNRMAGMTVLRMMMMRRRKKKISQGSERHNLF
jgi:hypothetical protein